MYFIKNSWGKFLPIFFLAQWLLGCHSPQNKNSNHPTNEPPKPSDKSSKELATIYCGSCHLFPEPNLLDKTNWTKTLLPNMGSHLGIKTTGYDPYKGLSGIDAELTKNEEIYPTQPLINQQDWDKIVAFYKENAPEELPRNTHKFSIKTLSEFEVMRPNLSDVLPLVTLAKIENNQLFLGLLDGRLLTLNKNLQKTASYNIATPPVAMSNTKNGFLSALGIGEIRPNQRDEGVFFQIDQKQPQLFQLNSLHYLKRPVDFVEIDLNDDKQNEVVVCEYGYLTGELAWYEYKQNRWVKHILSEAAGASKILKHDFDHDGRADLLLLFAQGNEHISVFYNKGNGAFEEKLLLKFPPIYGSSDVQLLDFNHDGNMDLLYTNGDNEDFSYTQKPYHGIRVFLNDGNNNFIEKMFWPMNGAFKSVGADFDLDGDIDIATISFFPDNQKQPASNFLYFEQTKPLVFQAKTFDDAANGNWMTLDANDIDGDGDKDIVIGSFGLNKSKKQKGKKELPFLVLKNTKKH